MIDVATQRIYRWALETRIGGVVDAASVARAASQYRAAGGAQVWLLDAGGASGLMPDALPAVKSQLAGLIATGLDRLAVVLPALARPFAPQVVAQIEAGAMLPGGRGRLRVTSFDSRDEATTWLRRGCK